VVLNTDIKIQKNNKMAACSNLSKTFFTEIQIISNNAI